MGSIPGLGTKIPQVTRHNQKIIIMNIKFFLIENKKVLSGIMWHSVLTLPQIDVPVLKSPPVDHNIFFFLLCFWP